MFVAKQLVKRRVEGLKTTICSVCHLHLQVSQAHKLVIASRQLNPSLSHRFYSQSSTSNIVKSPFPDEPVPSVPYHEYFWSKMDNWVDSTAVKCGVSGQQLTYNQIRKCSRNFGVALRQDVGVKTDERLGVFLPNCPEYISIVMGSLEAGVVVTTMNHVYTPDEVAYQLKDSEPSAVVTQMSLLPVLQKAIKLLNNNSIKIILIRTKDSEPIPSGAIDYNEMVANRDSSCLNDVKRRPEDLAILPYSSGTTGRPKGVMLTNQNLTSNLIAIMKIGDHVERSEKEKEVVPLVLPMFHIYGAAITFATLFYGGEIITLPKFEEESFLRSLSEATVLYVAPPLILYLAASPKITPDTLKNLKSIVSGAAPISASDSDRLFKKLRNTGYKQGYGLTETSPIVLAAPQAKSIPASVGNVVVNTQVKVINYETGQVLGPDEPGEILVKGPQVMKGYWKNQSATDEVIKDGWFYTGDIGHYDSNGYFYVTDRRKELIKVKGFQVAPAELEGVLRSHKDVADAGVIGAPDPIKGEKPVAFVVLKSGVEQNTEVLKTFLQEKLSKFKQINDFIYVSSIPKSTAGKILRRELKKILEERLTKEKAS